MHISLHGALPVLRQHGMHLGVGSIEGPESSLNRRFSQMEWRRDRLLDLLVLVNHEVPAPQGYRWTAELRSGGYLVMLLERDREGMPAGYSFGARVIAGYDGGNHEIMADAWRCLACSALIIQGDEPAHDAHHELTDRLATA